MSRPKATSGVARRYIDALGTKSVPLTFDLDARAPSPLDLLIMREDGLAEPPESQEDPRLERLRDALKKLPPTEQDIMSMWLGGARQADMGKIFGMSQAAIAYRIRRAFLRIDYWVNLPPFDAEAFARDAVGTDLTPYDVDLISEYVRTTTMTAFRKKRGISPNGGHHQRVRSGARLKKAASECIEMVPYWEAYCYALDHGSLAIETEFAAGAQSLRGKGKNGKELEKVRAEFKVLTVWSSDG